MAQWTTRKLARLRECYAVMTSAQLLAEFAPHTYPSIKTAAHKLRLRRRKDWMAIARAHVPVLTFGQRAGEVVK